jgi:O-antigen/teichoic acid export membrane protein
LTNTATGLIAINKVKLEKVQFLYFARSYITFGFLNFVLLFISSIAISFLFEGYWVIFVVIPIISFFMFLISFHYSELIQDGHSISYGLYNLFNVVITTLLTLFFLSGLSLDWDGRIFAMLISQILVVMLMHRKTFKTLKLFKVSINKIQFKKFIVFGFPLLLALGAGWILNQIDSYMVLYFFTLKDVGVYTVAYSVGAAVNTINQAATNAIMPMLYNALEKKEGHKIIKKINLYYSTLIILISLIVGVGSYWYIPIIFGDSYLQSANIVFFIALAFGFNGVYRTTGGVIAFYKKNNLQMKIVYLGAIVNVIFSLIFIPYFGIISPAIGTMIAFMLLAYMSYLYSMRILLKEEKL